MPDVASRHFAQCNCVKRRGDPMWSPLRTSPLRLDCAAEHHDIIEIGGDRLGILCAHCEEANLSDANVIGQRPISGRFPYLAPSVAIKAAQQSWLNHQAQ